jgi:nucleoid-associated protein YejK
MDPKTLAKVNKINQLVDNKYLGKEKAEIKKFVGDYFDDFVKASTSEFTKFSSQDLVMALVDFTLSKRYPGNEKAEIYAFVSQHYDEAKACLIVAEKEYAEAKRRERTTEDLKKRCTSLLKTGARCRNNGTVGGKCKRHSGVPAPIPPMPRAEQ